MASLYRQDPDDPSFDSHTVYGSAISGYDDMVPWETPQQVSG